ncbi:MAG: inositol monophosphatase family protein [Parachlamydiaceae bacterium]
MELFERQQIAKEAKEIAHIAGEQLLYYWGKLTQVREKGFFWDLVTEADLASEACILEQIKKRFPSHDILSEESGLYEKGESRFKWMVDPLDGTTNYTHQYPMVSISMGLVIDGVPEIGIVYNPILQEMFEAVTGAGAFLNDKSIHVSTVSSLDRSLLATGFAYDRKETKDNNYKEFCHLTNLSQGVRRLGSAALDLAYVAAGRLDGYWERGLKPWDMAAGVVLVREAGGLVTSYESGSLDISSGRILATNRHIHPILSRELMIAKDR